ncbi:MAG: hypothetical protein GTN62_14955 [Gemmatimonadales bacterium]|nr:hypothetical protein [Gemmatimonadales bacterium]NIN13385.1 hypothetical protein [Gemmatimonadales bacterium]NIN51388.1 hypothetical protein [Gemmatimonadales bacterium]NIP08852.1 hypothetical protein [Gemmatimonadales bacterium]NIQ99846.1 hypothetical protein [Gemmatimonadales bacterium]
MTGCTESSLGLIYRELDETVESLVPVVEALLQHIAPAEAVTCESDEAGYRLATRIRFPDGIGRGHVVAQLFRYRETVRLDVEISHNRMLARHDGRASDRRCYLNDFVATVSLPAKVDHLPPDFERSVLSGVRNAIHAVQRYNRAQAAPWNQITVAAAEPAMADLVLG